MVVEPVRLTAGVSTIIKVISAAQTELATRRAAGLNCPRGLLRSPRRSRGELAALPGHSLALVLPTLAAVAAVHVRRAVAVVTHS